MPNVVIVLEVKEVVDEVSQERFYFQAVVGCDATAIGYLVRIFRHGVVNLIQEQLREFARSVDVTLTDFTVGE